MKLRVGVQDGFHEIVGRLEESLGYHLLGKNVYPDCLTIVDEFYANLTAYVAPKSDNFFWFLGVDVDSCGIRIQIEYPGPCFDPTQQSEIPEQAIEMRPIGGLGLGIVSVLSDKLEYHYENGWNVINVQLNDTKQFEDMD